MNSYATKPRMTSALKASYAALVYDGKMKIEDAVKELDSSEEEIKLWIRRLKKFGSKGLHATRIQQIRKMEADNGIVDVR